MELANNKIELLEKENYDLQNENRNLKKMIKSLKEDHADPEKRGSLLEENEQLKNLIQSLQQYPKEESFTKRSVLDHTLHSNEFSNKHLEQEEATEEDPQTAPTVSEVLAPEKGGQSEC